MTSPTPQAQLPEYKCHKSVWALKIKEVIVHAHPDPSADQAAFEASAEFQGAHLFPENARYGPIPIDAAWYRKHNPVAGGYYVQYADGYTSFSPAKAFEEGYRLKDLTLENALYGNDRRKDMIWRRDRRLDTSHDPLTPTELVKLYGPYLEHFDHNGLEPREVRLLETIISAIA